MLLKVVQFSLTRLNLCFKRAKEERLLAAVVEGEKKRYEERRDKKELELTFVAGLSLRPNELAWASSFPLSRSFGLSATSSCVPTTQLPDATCASSPPPRRRAFTTRLVHPLDVSQRRAETFLDCRRCKPSVGDNHGDRTSPCFSPPGPKASTSFVLFARSC